MALLVPLAKASWFISLTSVSLVLPLHNQNSFHLFGCHNVGRRHHLVAKLSLAIILSALEKRTSLKLEIVQNRIRLDKVIWYEIRQWSKHLKGHLVPPVRHIFASLSSGSPYMESVKKQQKRQNPLNMESIQWIFRIQRFFTVFSVYRHFQYSKDFAVFPCLNFRTAHK